MLVQECKCTTELNFNEFTLRQVSDATVSSMHAGGEVVGQENIQDKEGKPGECLPSLSGSLSLLVRIPVAAQPEHAAVMEGEKWVLLSRRWCS